MTTETTSKPEALEQIEAFERQFRYDATYMKEMLAAAPEALAAFQAFLQMVGHRKECPLAHYHVAGIAAFREVDCGPCLQLNVRYAVAAGLPSDLIEAALNNPDLLPTRHRQVHEFARAILRGEPTVDSLRATLVEALGETSVIEIGLRVASAQVFPVVKRAMGHYQSCALTRIEIAA